jgi:hypothetical protein
MIEITSAFVLLVSSLYGSVNVAIADDILSSDYNHKQPVDEPVTLEGYVREYFNETSVLAEISRCESHFRQYDRNGQVLRGKVNSDDLGLMQINEYFHGKRANELGLDLKTIEGNLAYAQYLYDKEGTKPWNASSKCWSE